MHGQPRPLVASLLIAAVLLLVQLGGEPLATQLEYRRDAVLAGEWWRLWTAHLVHLGWAHAVLNGASLIVLLLVFAHRGAFGRLFALAAFCAMAISTGLLLGHAEITWYRGASGLVYGYLAWGILNWLATPGRVVGAAVLLALAIGKTAIDFMTRTPVIDVGAAVIVEAHIYGIASSALAFLAVNVRGALLSGYRTS